MTVQRYVDNLLERAVAQMLTAQEKFPQPNYVLLKVAEEAGEVVQAGVHLAEGRDFTKDDLDAEIIDLIAMALRLAVEGDQINGVPPKTFE